MKNNMSQVGVWNKPVAHLLTHQPSRNIGLMQAVGLKLASVLEIADAYALAENLVGPPLATLETMRAIQKHTTSSIFIVRESERVTGVVAELPVTSRGLQAIEAGSFNGTDPVLTHVAQPGEPVSAFYCWGCAAETRKAAALTVKAVVAARNNIYADVPFFTRAALPKGETATAGSKGGKAAMRRFDCTPYPGQPGLLFSPKASTPRRDAA